MPKRECSYRRVLCARTAGARVREGLGNRGGAKRKPRREGSTQRGQGQYRGRGPTPRASLQRGSLILREDCYNVVTKAPTLGNDSVVPDGKRERGVHACYALLGTRSAGGGRSPGDRLGLYLLARRWL